MEENPMKRKNLLSLKDWTKDEIMETLDFALRLKEDRKQGIENKLLKDKYLGMIFSKASTRTRVSFEVGIQELGGHAIFLNSGDLQLGRGETISDTAKVLSRYIDAIMIRTHKQKDVVKFAKYSSIPVINGLTDKYHPCQVLADLQTILEQKGRLKGLKLAYIGDGNNVANTLLIGCSKVGMNISVATPPDYPCDSKVITCSRIYAKASNSTVVVTTDPYEAVVDADIVYTDTWISMGKEDEETTRLRSFKGYQVNSDMVSRARPDYIFLHCLPAYRDYEVTADVIDGDHSKVFDQAENRLHVQKAIMFKLMK
jgi:ornithine carbamoyltransferase